MPPKARQLRGKALPACRFVGVRKHLGGRRSMPPSAIADGREHESGRERPPLGAAFMAPRLSTGSLTPRINVFVLNRCVRSGVAATVADGASRSVRDPDANAARGDPNNWVHLLPA